MNNATKRQPRDFLEACRKAGRDPKEIKSVESYMRGWHQVRKPKRKGNG